MYIPFCARKNVKRVDALIITTDKSDEGLGYLADKMEISQVFFPPAYRTDAGLTYVGRANSFSEGTVFAVDGIRFEILACNDDENCAAVKASYFNTSIVLPGDFAAENTIGNNLKGDVVRLTKNTPLGGGQLRGIKYAVLDAGYYSGAELSEQLGGALEKGGIKVLGTYEHGSITFDINRKGISSVKKTRLFNE